MTTATVHQRQPIGTLLRQWRERRRVSQLNLALSAEISTRHLSFVETGRSRPSSEMVLRLAEHLDIPLRARNQLLVAAGHAPIYPETGLADPRVAAPRQALRHLLAGHEPYPAVVVDRGWNLVERNTSVQVLLDGVTPKLLESPVNVLRMALHPEGMAPRIVNLGQWRAHLLGRLRRHVALTGDDELTALLRELSGYPCEQLTSGIEVPEHGELMVPLRIWHPAGELAFFSTVTTFGTPLEVTLAELVIESFFPADAFTRQVLRKAAE